MCKLNLPDDIKEEVLRGEHPQIPIPILPTMGIIQLLDEDFESDVEEEAEGQRFNVEAYLNSESEDNGDILDNEEEWAAMGYDDDLDAISTVATLGTMFDRDLEDYLGPLLRYVVDEDQDIFDEDEDFPDEGSPPSSSWITPSPVQTSFTEEYLESTIGSVGENTSRRSAEDESIMMPEGETTLETDRLPESSSQGSGPFECRDSDWPVLDKVDFPIIDFKIALGQEQVVEANKETDESFGKVEKDANKEINNGDVTETLNNTISSLQLRSQIIQDAIDTQMSIQDLIKDAIDSLKQMAEITQNAINRLESSISDDESTEA